MRIHFYYNFADSSRLSLKGITQSAIGTHPLRFIVRIRKKMVFTAFSWLWFIASDVDLSFMTTHKKKKFFFLLLLLLSEKSMPKICATTKLMIQVIHVSFFLLVFVFFFFFIPNLPIKMHINDFRSFPHIHARNAELRTICSYEIKLGFEIQSVFSFFFFFFTKHRQFAIE